MTKYVLIPHYSKSLTETQFWNRTLKNGKSVTLKVSNVYRCFQFEIELNDVEKAEMLKMDTIPLDNYSFTPDETEGCDCWREIINEADFTEEEKAEIDEEAWSSLYSDTSRPFAKPKSGRIAVKVINHLGDEVMKVFSVG